jgi:catechol 2,3-dioxygenase-like lactoylglutathione lyase family enzyme
MGESSIERKRNMTHTKSASRTAIAVLALAASLSTLAAAQERPLPPETKPLAVSPSTLPFNGIAHIAIRVKDIAASVAFYNKLGYQQAFAMTKGDVITQSFLKINDKQFIELYPITPGNPTQDKPEFLHLCFEGVDLNAIHDAYVAEGLTPIAVRKAGAGNLLFTLKGPQQFRDPQNIEYTQYQPGSLHSNDVGLHLGPERIADKMTVVTLAMQYPAAARTFYVDKLGFTAIPTNPMLLNLPGTSGEQVEIVPLSELGARSRITLETLNITSAQKILTDQKIPFVPSKLSAAITDPDGNQILIKSHR